MNPTEDSKDQDLIKKDAEDNVRVVIRCRPLLQDIESGQDTCVNVGIIL